MKRSAGLLVYRKRGGRLEVLLAHPGGPYFKNKDEGAWTLPKGLVDEGEEPLDAAKRELREETGMAPPEGPYEDLGEIRQRGGKVVRAFACMGDFDPATLVSNTYEVEWPPRSGKRGSFPEVDRVEWFDIAAAGKKILAAQRELLARLSDVVDPGPHESA